LLIFLSWKTEITELYLEKTYIKVMAEKQFDILTKLANGEISAEEAAERLNKQTKRQVITKLTPKGCIGFYGIRQMPISLYPKELVQIINHVVGEDWTPLPEFEEFLKENSITL
jgi:hypothetical protein